MCIRDREYARVRMDVHPVAHLRVNLVPQTTRGLSCALCREPAVCTLLGGSSATGEAAGACGAPEDLL